MIIVHGLIPILPERRSEALKLVRWMEQETQAEAGCLSYRFFVGLRDPNTLMLFQEWETLVAGDIQTRRYAVALEDDEEDEGGWEEDEARSEIASVRTPPIIH